jgi:hypothetical protein
MAVDERFADKEKIRRYFDQSGPDVKPPHLLTRAQVHPSHHNPSLIHAVYRN